MKPRITFLLTLTIFSLQPVFTQTLVNNGGKMVVEDGTALVIDGDFKNLDDGNIVNSGFIAITGDWANSATSGNLMQGSTGEVKFNGPSSQIIQGSAKS